MLIYPDRYLTGQFGGNIVRSHPNYSHVVLCVRVCVGAFFHWKVKAGVKMCLANGLESLVFPLFTNFNQGVNPGEQTLPFYKPERTTKV